MLLRTLRLDYSKLNIVDRLSFAYASFSGFDLVSYSSEVSPFPRYDEMLMVKLLQA